MTIFNAVDGQSLCDVCVNTYGSMDYFYKLLTDNNIPNANYVPASGIPFNWDETLVVDFIVGQTITKNKIKYATAASGNGNVWFVVVGAPVLPPSGIPGNINPPQPSTMYQKTSSFYNTLITLIAISLVRLLPLLSLISNIRLSASSLSIDTPLVSTIFLTPFLSKTLKVSVPKKLHNKLITIFILIS
jgi:hypothetical protein